MTMSKEQMMNIVRKLNGAPQPKGHCKCVTNVEIQERIKMKTPQEKAAELLPFVQALANGEDVLEGGYPATGTFIHGIAFSIKPKMTLVNGFEVPEPIRVKPNNGDNIFVASIDNISFCFESTWINHEVDCLRLSRCVCHSTKEAAIAHAKAMLNIDPNGGE